MLNATTADKNTIRIIRKFKTTINNEIIADRLAKETVEKGLKEDSRVFKRYYGDDEPDFIIMSCISFGLVNFMEEDFYVVKEVLGYEYVINILNKSSYLKVVK